MNERFITEDNQLTVEGKELARQMFNSQCDRRPCFLCGSRNPKTKGPGGPRCPAAEKLENGRDVDKILTIFMGRPPQLEALDSFLPYIKKK